MPSTTQALSPQQLKTIEIDELIVLAQQDDHRALTALVERVQRNVYLTLHQLAPERQDIADLSQEVLLRMCRSIKSLRNPKTFKYWLNRIITNLFYDELRKVPRRLKTVSMDEPQFQDEGDANPTRDIPDSSLLPDATTINRELDDVIQKAIENLPEQFRTIVVLREMQGLSYEEIASLTQTNLGTVKSRLARARERLQSELAPYLKEQ